MHNLKTLGADISALLKTSGDSGDTGDSKAKPLKAIAISVTSPLPQVSPLDLRVVTGSKTSGDSFHKQNQLVEVGVTTVTSVTTTFERDRAAAESNERLMHSAHVPDEWREDYRLLRQAEPLEDFRSNHWQSMTDDGAAFLAQWGDQAVALGWRDVDVFGVHPRAPAARAGCLGLAFVIHGGEVVALTEASATVRRQSGARLTWRRVRDGEQVPIWSLLPRALA